MLLCIIGFILYDLKKSVQFIVAYPVDPGFKEVERPFIYCRTYNNLPNGYQFTNRVEVGGMYEMQKVKAEDSFTTKIYAPTVDRGKLPKTGY